VPAEGAASSKPQLLVWKGDTEYVPYSELHLTEDEQKVWQHQLSTRKVDGALLECWLDEHKRWRFKAEADGQPRFRGDQTTGHHISKVPEVRASMEEHITEADLLVAAAAKHLPSKRSRDEEDDEEEELGCRQKRRCY
ncbi:hypothetical protein LTS18_003538, partial [Coniosporium uncinatum]